MKSDLTPGDIIELLELAPLEGEGGYFCRTWFRPAATGDRPEASCIYYLITPDSFSSLHRLVHDEMFHFYLGDPCRSITMSENGIVEECILGQDIRAGERVQHLVPGGIWQATTLLEGGRFALLGTTMSPGFHESGFVLGTSALLTGLEPGAQEIIREVLANQHAS